MKFINSTLTVGIGNLTPHMINLKSLLTEAKVPQISLQMARDRKLFGPVYHGTSAEARDKIAMDGFKIPIGRERSGAVANGFETSDYAGGIPAPMTRKS